ncbi:MAG: hypothetical protein NT047_03660 [Deltaproteobacteria bacterium]|nr:hypothetical protein [Deltaproteobacteria bacterium]
MAPFRMRILSGILLLVLMLIWSVIDAAAVIQATAATAPSWYEHVDLMQIILAALIALVGILLGVGLKVGFKLLMTKMNEMCIDIKGKADQTDLDTNKEDHAEMWRRVNHHSHIINCNQDGCKPECGQVVISEGPS